MPRIQWGHLCQWHWWRKSALAGFRHILRTLSIDNINFWFLVPSSFDIWRLTMFRLRNDHSCQTVNSGNYQQLILLHTAKMKLVRQFAQLTFSQPGRGWRHAQRRTNSISSKQVWQCAWRHTLQVERLPTHSCSSSTLTQLNHQRLDVNLRITIIAGRCFIHTLKLQRRLSCVVRWATSRN